MIHASSKPRHSGPPNLKERFLDETKGVPRNGGRKQQLVWSCFTYNLLRVQTLPWDPLSSPLNIRLACSRGFRRVPSGAHAVPGAELVPIVVY